MDYFRSLRQELKIRSLGKWTACSFVVWLCCWPLYASCQTSPLVTLNGHSSPSFLAQGSQEVMIPLAALHSGLGARIEEAKANKVNVSLNDHKVELELEKKRILYWPDRTAKIPTLTLLKETPMMKKGEIWIPASIAPFLGATLEKPETGKITITSQAEDGPEVWKRLLGLPDSFKPTKGEFAISRMKVVASGEGGVNADIVLNLTLSAPGYVQVYEVTNGKIEPMFAQDGEDIALYPLHSGNKAIPLKVSPKLRVSFRLTQPGVHYYIALATTEATEQDLLELLKSGHSPGEWALNGYRIEVKKP